MKSNLYSYLYKLNKEGKAPFNMNSNDISYGDESYYEQNVTFEFKIGDNSYIVGWYSVTEDREDWAQAENYNGDIFIKNGKNVSQSEIFNDINNYIQIERETKLNKLIND